MITPMTKYSFILLNGEQENLLEKLQELGVVDITRSVKPVDTKSHEYAGELDLIDGLLKAINKIELPEGTKEIPYEGEGTEDPIRTAGGILMSYSETTNNIKGLEKEVKDLAIWGEYDKTQLSQLEEAGVPIHFHVLSLKKFQEEWKENFALVEAGRDSSNVYFVVAGEDTLPGAIPTPQDDIAQAKKKLEEERQKLEKLQGVILYMKQFIPDLLKYREEVCSKLDLHLAELTAVPAAEDTIVTLVGYAPAENDAAICKTLDGMDLVYLKEEARAQDNPPIQFKNNKFVRQFEVLTDMYGRPAYNGFDPTPFISFFFLLFFALCMGDAGYGLILILIGLALKKVDSFKDMASLVMTLGAGTVVVGFFLHTFFSIDIAQWKVFEPIKGIFLPDEIAGYAGGMVLSIVIGIIHLCLAMSVKAIQSVKVKGFAASLGTLGWTLLIVGGVIVAALALVGVLNATATKWIVLI